MTTRRQLMQGAAVSMLGLSHLPNFAQTRVENLRIIVGFPPGGTTDAFSRRIAEKMRGTYATNVIVDNKPGAGGQIGVTTLKAAAADGAHILYSPASMLTIYPHSYSRLSYAQSDVTPIAIGRLGAAPQIRQDSYFGHLWPRSCRFHPRCCHFPRSRLW